MESRWAAAGGVALGAILGALGASLLRDRGDPPPSAEPCECAEDPSAGPVSVAPPDPTPTSVAPTTDDACTAQLEACLAVLGANERPHAELFSPDVVEDGPESPSEWSQRVDQVFSACGLDHLVEYSDCERYPCLAMIRPQEGVADDAALRAQLEDCPAYEDFRQHLPNPDATSLMAHCPDGTTEEVIVFSAVDDEGEPIRQFAPEPTMAMALYSQRVHESLRSWRCLPEQ